MLSRDAMCREVERALDVVIEGPGAELHLDSLQFLELCVFLDDLGVFLPEEYYPELRCVDDIHHYYVTTRGHDR